MAAANTTYELIEISDNATLASIAAEIDAAIEAKEASNWVAIDISTGPIDFQGTLKNVAKITYQLDTVQAGQGVATSKVVSLYQPSPGAADADVAARVLFKAPVALTITSIQLIPVTASAGVDGSNTVVFAFQKNDTDLLETQTYTADLVAGTDIAFETLNATNAVFAAGDELTMDITQGTTADIEDFIVQVNYTAVA